MNGARGVRARLAAAAVTGTRHRALGAPCQDHAAAVRRGATSIIALADGAGSAASSHRGARVAVAAAIDILGEDFRALVRLGPDDVADRLLAGSLRALRGCSLRTGTAFDELASTLLFVATDGNDYVCGQIGDGRVARFGSDLANPESVFAPTKGEFFNETVFVGSASARARFQVQVGGCEGVGGFALMSDGSEETLFNRAEGRFAPALGRMMGWLESYGERRVRAALARNLGGALAERTDDDLSLALLRLVPT